VLDAAHEATMLEAIINARRKAANIVLLTSLGGGAFGNAPEWIHAAIKRAVKTTIDGGAGVGEQAGLAPQCIYLAARTHPRGR
jgi:hypothetical protein